MDDIACFWTEATGEVEVGLRRFVYVTRRTSPCTRSYHDAVVPIGRRPGRNHDGVLEEIPVADYRDDPRWPTACQCGYRFVDDDEWQVAQEPVYRRPDTGEEWTQRSLPPGALFHAERLVRFGVGADGIALMAVCPPGGTDSRAHMWHVDGPARSEGHSTPNAWTRTGDPRAVPPTVTATPSILTADWHGYLTDGRFRQV